MNIDVSADARANAADEGQSPPNATTVRQHRALCQLGLPLQPGSGSWQRDIGTVALAIEPPSANPQRPYGAILRLLLLYIFDAAMRQDSPTVEIGDSPAALADRMGLRIDDASLRGLAEQFERLTAVKTTISLDGGTALGVFDARGRPRAVAAEWRSTVRLNARFFASLTDGAVPLDRAVVAALADAPLALDAYMWLASLLEAKPADGTAGAPWTDLYGRFGDAGQSQDAFRTAFEDAVRLVTAACPSIVVILGEQGVQARAATPESLQTRPPPRVPAAAPAPAPRAPAPPIPAAEAEIPARPQSQPQPAPAPEPAETQRFNPRQGISLKSHMTGLSSVIWLQRANGREAQVIEVTPGARYDPDHVTVLALEPMVVQISGGLYDREFERVSAWAMNNRDLIDDVWDGKLTNFDEVATKVKKVPAPGWR